MDIFFVISGYLITSHLVSSFQSGTFSFKDFFLRRLRRLLPALTVMLAVTTAVACFVLLPAELEKYSASLLYASTYLSNLFFLSQSGYFDNSAETSPLLHTWSLAVEEQFYIFFPVMLWLFFKIGKGTLLTLIVVGALISFLLSTWMVSAFPDAAFYISPTRFWQFMFGSIIAVAFSKPLLSKVTLECLVLVGLIMIIASIFFITNATPFPGINAVPATLGTALIIFAGKHNSTLVSSYILRIWPVRLVGQASYSIYLWHWPAIVFYKMEINSRPSMEEQVGLFCLSIILGFLSWIAIENTTRKIDLKHYKSVLLSAAAGSAILALTFNFFVLQKDGVILNYPQKALHYGSYLNYDMGEQARRGTCFLTSGSRSIKDFSESECIKTNDDKSNIVLLGDSLNAHLYKASTDILTSHNISQINASGCKPLINTRGNKICTALMRDFFEKYIHTYDFDTVILSARWKKEDINAILETVKFLRILDVRAIVLGPIPEYNLDLPRALAKNEMSADPDFISKWLNKDIFIIDSTFKDAFGSENQNYISLVDILCISNGSCKTIEDDVPLQFDYGHLTYEGAVFLLKEIQRRSDI